MKVKLKACIVCVLMLMYAGNLSQADKKKKKDPRDYTDADLYKLEEEWTEDGDIDEGDLPEHLRKAEPVDISKVDADDPEGMVKMTKRHKTLMMFATVSGDPTEKETEEITTLWQNSLYNANIEITRFVISPNRILIKLTDGSYAYEIKDFLIQQERCEAVTIEGRSYPGKGSPDFGKDDKKKKEDKKKKTGSKKKKGEKKKDEKSGKKKQKAGKIDKNKKTKKEEL